MYIDKVLYDGNESKVCHSGRNPVVNRCDFKWNVLILCQIHKSGRYQVIICMTASLNTDLPVCLRPCVSSSLRLYSKLISLHYLIMASCTKCILRASLHHLILQHRVRNEGTPKRIPCKIHIFAITFDVWKQLLHIFMRTCQF